MSLKQHLLRTARPLVTRRLPSVAMAYRYIRDNGRIMDEPRETSMGFKMLGNKPMAEGDFEPDETAIVRVLLDSVDVVVNAGANIGYYCCLSLQQGKHVVAFEPMVSNLRYLYSNIRANHWDDMIEIFPLALSNRIGIIDIFGGGTGASLVKGWSEAPDDYVNVVPTSTLDIVLGSRFIGMKCLLIVDIEGSELLMLEGASLFLSADPKPMWMVEIAVTEHQPQGIAINPHLLSTFRTFWERGYESWTADKSLRLVQPDEVNNIVKSGTDTLFTHNFLFIEEGRKRAILDV